MIVQVGLDFTLRGQGEPLGGGSLEPERCAGATEGCAGGWGRGRQSPE